jgi:protein transport protein SEC61 subunit gamma-like protein
MWIEGVFDAFIQDINPVNRRFKREAASQLHSNAWSDKMDIKAGLRKYARVLQIARKPGKDEFVNSSKICALGLALIGVVGFAIFLVFILSGI